MSLEDRKIKWTCFICHKIPPEHSLDSLENQENEKKSIIFIDGDYWYVVNIFWSVSVYYPKLLMLPSKPDSCRVNVFSIDHSEVVKNASD